MSWWPYGALAEELADAVKNGTPTGELVDRIKRQAGLYRQFDALVEKLKPVITACRWNDANAILEEMESIPLLDQTEILHYQWLVATERELTPLDRIVEATEE